MNLLSWSEFKQLDQISHGVAVTIYLPTHEAGAEIQQDPIRLKNLLREAEGKLQAMNMDKSQISSILSEAFDLIERDRFWQHKSQGLALYLTPDKTHIYRLPLTFESSVIVSDRFYLKPLLPLFFDNRYFYILALSQNQVRLFQSTRYDISEVELTDVPTSLAEALRYDDPEAQLQFHSAAGGGTQPIYHGQGTSGKDDKVNIRRFLNQVNDALCAHYLNGEAAPLVIASVEYLRPIYEAVNTYPHLMSEGVNGNPDQAEPNELREQAWPIVAHLIEETRQDAIAQYQELARTQQASNQVSQVVTAAMRGQVETLLLAKDAQVWGQIDAQSGKANVHDDAQSGDYDLLAIAAVKTALQGGKVYFMDPERLPDAEVAAGIFRYEVPAGV
jgi:hypothetical protein